MYHAIGGHMTHLLSHIIYLGVSVIQLAKGISDGATQYHDFGDVGTDWIP